MGKKNVNRPDKPETHVPQGLNNLLAKSPDKLQAFYTMEEGARNAIIAQAKKVQSRSEMEALVAHIGGEGLVR